MFLLRTSNNFKNAQIDTTKKHSLFWDLPPIKCVGAFAFVLGHTIRSLSVGEEQLEPDGKDFRYIFEVKDATTCFVRKNQKWVETTILMAYNEINNGCCNEVIIDLKNGHVVKTYRKQFGTPNGYDWVLLGNGGEKMKISRSVSGEKIVEAKVSESSSILVSESDWAKEKYRKYVKSQYPDVDWDAVAQEFESDEREEEELMTKYFFREKEIVPTEWDLLRFRENGGYILPVMSSTNFMRLRKKVGHEEAVNRRNSRMKLVCDNKETSFIIAQEIAENGETIKLRVVKEESPDNICWEGDTSSHPLLYKGELGYGLLMEAYISKEWEEVCPNQTEKGEWFFPGGVLA